MNVTLLHYNNYFNRIVKKEDTLNAYKAADPSYSTVSNINFVPGDGITTSLILGTSALVMNFDYLIVSEVVSNVETILSRWFIMDENRTRDGQYEIGLRRDVIVDNYSNVLNAPIFLEKGYIDDVNSPLLFNSEGIGVNQIKETETALKDETNSGWVVGYVPYDAFDTQQIIEKDVIVSTPADITVAGISNWTYWKNCTNNPSYKYLSNSSGGNASVGFKIKSHCTTTTGQSVSTKRTTYFESNVITFETNTNNVTTSTIQEQSMQGAYSSITPPTWYTNYCNLECSIAQYPVSVRGYLSANAGEIVADLKNNSTFLGYIQAYIGGDVEIGDPTGLIALKDKIIYDSSTGDYYQIKLRAITHNEPMVVTNSTTAGSNIISYMNNNLVRTVQHVTGTTTYINSSTNLASGDITVQLASSAYAVELEQVSVNAFVQLDSNRSHLEDAPYDMFCIPYSDTLKLYDGTDTFTANRSIAIAIASGIAEKSGNANLFDVQLLPYCPARNIVSASADPGTTLDLTNGNFDIIYQTDGSGSYVALPSNPGSQEAFDSAATIYGNLYTYDSGTQEYYRAYYWSSGVTYYYRTPAGTTKLSAVIWCTRSSFQVNLSHNIAVANTSIEKKVQNECDLYRLCSGNYNGIFEFSVAKSNGVDGFVADCTYKPYSPYIHVMPKLKGLYGQNFVDIDDSRGLICGGDFSLPQLTDAWANYELQNKNYQQIFDREIKHLDISNEIANQQAIAGAIAGTVTGGVGGAVAGGSKGGIPGAIAGAAIGTVTSAVAGGLDLQNLRRMQQETKEYAIDMYNYKLGNIQALPTSLTKSSALTYNTRVWPFVEYYTCTSVERQALRDKITYNGMTIMIITTLANFVSGTRHFYKGQIIRLDELNADNHMANEIYNEINKGVYL